MVVQRQDPMAGRGRIRQGYRALGRITMVALAAAFLWSIVVIVGGLFLSPTSVESSSGFCTAAGHCTNVVTETPSPTLLHTDGLVTLVPLSAPLVATLVVGAMLWRRRCRARRRAGAIAWVVTGALCGLCLLGILSIGLFVLPVAVGLVVACATFDRQAETTPDATGPGGHLPSPASPYR